MVVERYPRRLIAVQQGDFTAVSSHEGSKTKFAVDLSEGEWYDYDEKAGEEVSITNCVWEMRRSV